MNYITITGAREHNLKNISVRIPKGKLVVCTGVSGSGKSTLVYDTLYAEARRRFVESLSHSARTFMEQIPPPDVDSVEGLVPAIAIDQRTSVASPRSTVGTLSGVYDSLRSLIFYYGSMHCPDCRGAMHAKTAQDIVDLVLRLEEKTKVQVFAPVALEKAKEKAILNQFVSRGYSRFRINGSIFSFDNGDVLPDAIQKAEVVLDRVVIKSGILQRVTDAVESAYRIGNGNLTLDIDGKTSFFSEKASCSKCQREFGKPSLSSFLFNTPEGSCSACNGLGVQKDLEVSSICSVCLGTRVSESARLFHYAEKSFRDLVDMPVSDLGEFFESIKSREKPHARLVHLLSQGCRFLDETGVGYLSCSRSGNTLSVGELQRVRLSRQLGSGLENLLYIIDEPGSGLHPMDLHRVLKALENLRDSGNSVIVVDHRLETLERSDYILELGPGAGVEGGEVIAEGTLSEIQQRKNSLSAKILSKKTTRRVIEKKYRKGIGTLKISGITRFAFDNAEVSFVKQALNVITGVSGSGKSTLLEDILLKTLKSVFEKKTLPNTVSAIEGVESLSSVLFLNQSLPAPGARSNPATYSGIFDMVRDLFAKLPDARSRGYDRSRFSFNIKGGRCDRCKGRGEVVVQMHFLPDAYVDCPSCEGNRFNADTLSVQYRGLNIADVLRLTVRDACAFFQNIPEVHSRLVVLQELGLNYLSLGQSSATLSGGELQRLKLARELSAGSDDKHTVYLLDEPSRGLHPVDIQKLLFVLHRLVDAGNTIIAVDHSMYIAAEADWLVELGPGAGANGGRVLAEGAPD